MAFLQGKRARTLPHTLRAGHRVHIHTGRHTQHRALRHLHQRQRHHSLHPGVLGRARAAARDGKREPLGDAQRLLAKRRRHKRHLPGQEQLPVNRRVPRLHLQPLGTEAVRVGRPRRRMGRQVQRQGRSAGRVFRTRQGEGCRRQGIQHQARRQPA